MQDDPVVCVVDDDASVRRALDNLLRSAGWRVVLYASADEYLRSVPPEGPSCLVLDVRLPGMSGLELQERLARREVRPPIVFITGHGDIAMAVRAIQKGAIEFLTKPFREQDLLDAIGRAIECDRIARQRHTELRALRQRLSALTPREQQVMVLVAQGLANKVIAGTFDLTEATVKVHRGHVMKKMQAGSVAELVAMCITLGLVPGSTGPGPTPSAT